MRSATASTSQSMASLGSSTKGSERHHHTTAQKIERGSIAWRELLLGGLAVNDTVVSAKAKASSFGMQVLSWGGGYQGQLGVELEGNKKSRNTAQLVALPEGCEARHVACGANHSAVVTGDGRVFTWGEGKGGQLGYALREVSACQRVPREVGELSGVSVRNVACGRGHTVVLTYEGHVFAWGTNKSGQLGIGSRSNHQKPQRVECTGENGRPVMFEGVAAGDAHSAALTKTGRVYTWGHGAYGQLGIGELPRGETGALRPTLMTTMLAVKCRRLACSSQMTAIIAMTGELYCCGHVMLKLSATESPAADRTADGSERTAASSKRRQHFLQLPERVALECTVKDVACGRGHLVVLDVEGDVWTVGTGAAGQLGQGHSSDTSTSRRVLQGKSVMHVGAGRYHSVAVTSHGAIYTWGQGAHGQLCQGSNTDDSIPRLVSGVLHRAVLEVACGEYHSITAASAPIDAHPSQLTHEMMSWSYGEHEEFRMKSEIMHPNGVTHKHISDIGAKQSELMIKLFDGNAKMCMKRAPNGSWYPDVIRDDDTPMASDTELEDSGDVVMSMDQERKASARLIEQTHAAFDKMTASMDGGAVIVNKRKTGRQMQREKALAKTTRSRRELLAAKREKKTKEPERVGIVGSLANSRSALPLLAVPRDRQKTRHLTPRAAAPLSSRSLKSNASTPSSGRKLNSRDGKTTPRSRPPTEPKPPLNQGRRGSNVVNPRERMYAQMGDMQANIKQAVEIVAENNPGTVAAKLKTSVVEMREECSLLSVQRAAKEKQLADMAQRLLVNKLDMTGDEGADELKEEHYTLSTELQAVKLKFEEEIENRDSYKMVVEELREDLFQQQHLIVDMKEVESENARLFSRLKKRKMDALKALADTKFEQGGLSGEQDKIREDMRVHLKGIMQLTTCMDRTVRHVLDHDKSRVAKVERKKQVKLGKIKERLQVAEKKKEALRLAPDGIGVNLALLHMYEAKFAKITEATGLQITDAEAIVSRITSRQETLTEMEHNIAGRKSQVLELTGLKLQLEADFTQMRADKSRQNAIRMIDAVNDSITLAGASNDTQSTSYLKSMTVLLHLQQLAGTLGSRVAETMRRSVGYSSTAPPFQAQELALRQPTSDVEADAEFYGGVVERLAGRLVAMSNVVHSLERLNTAEREDLRESSFEDVLGSMQTKQKLSRRGGVIPPGPMRSRDEGHSSR